MDTLQELKERFSNYYNAVQIYHQNSSTTHHGHGFDHDVMVAQYAVYIAPSSKIGRKAWCAAFLHSLDRLADAEEMNRVVEKFARILRQYFIDDEVFEITEAARRHSELNQLDQSVTQQVLMDADRLANLNASVVIRGGQFRPNIPPFESEYLSQNNPRSTYHEPASVLDSLRLNVDAYLPQMRLDRAKIIAREYAGRLKMFERWVISDCEILGISGQQL